MQRRFVSFLTRAPAGRLGIVIVVVVAALLATPRAVQAADFRSGTAVTIAAGETVNDDLFVLATTVEIAGTVNGDVFALGQSVTVTGTVRGSLHAAAQTVAVSGSVGNSLRLAGQSVTVDGRVGRDVMAAGQTVVLDTRAALEGAGYLAGSSVIVNGTIARDLTIGAERATLNGTVRGNVSGEIDRLTLTQNARIGGNLTYTSERDASIEAGAVVAGATERQTPAVRERRERPEPRREGNLLGELIGRVMAFTMGLVVGALAILVAPGATARVADTFRQHPWWSALAGVLALIVTPIMAFVLLFTIVGIPLSVIGLVIWGVMLYLAPLAAGLIAARYVPALRRDNRRSSQLAAFIAGLAAMSVLTAIPLLGGLVALVAVVAGLGALVMALIPEAQRSIAGA